ncbi:MULTISPECIES: vWA domain-containing protein [Gilliamella]|uniref:VWA domain-containing protein n=1 Tax=Gilliamella apicola TaxID=1196095 RepID=A0A556SC37_9GAMM|nr:MULTISPECIES: VWA domain-containing protein [Gilliamella]MBI0095215.1 VWA domain-containing protein [Gilliamella sp. W8136]TSJ98716.1 VWA domain-containing protein [Gilliamella apicola]
MQRIIRIKIDHNDFQKMSLLDQYNSLLTLLKPHLTERTFSILATPKLIDDNQYLGWYTDLQGQPVFLNSIADEVLKKQISEKLQTRICDIELTIKSLQLNEDQQALVSSWLPRIKSLGNQIYIVNGEPVIINTFEDPILPPPVVALSTIPMKKFWRWWHFLILALLFAALGSLLYFLYPFNKANIVDEIPKLTIIPPVLVKKPEPEPEPAPVARNCIPKEDVIKNNNASKMVMIFDNSASMTLTLMESKSAIDQYLASDFSMMTEKEADAYEARMTRLPNRLSSSKKVALSTIDKIQQDINIALVTLTSCPVAQTTSFYDHASREKLKNKINKLNPLEYNSATPLYSGVQQASKMLDGVNRDDYILIISDGEDNCTKSNICTLASKIAAKQPRLKINIVDIAGQHKIDCVAKSTGGKVYIAQNPTEIVNQMNNAVSDLNITKPICE